MSREEQCNKNVERLVDDYYNDICDGYVEPFENETQYIEYIVDNIYNIKVDGGYVKYMKGICEDLKFLGSAKLYEIAMKYAEDVMAE